jgi:hypothetical protein
MNDYVFCTICEKRFNEGGEQWVLARVPRDYHEPFVLQDALTQAHPHVITPALVLYEGAKIAAFDMDQLVYFGASIFWRGAVHEWEIDGQQAPEVNLEDKEESLRVFLIGRGSFPSDVWLTIDISAHKPVLNGFLAPMPTPNPRAGWNRYWFYFFGLGFELHFGSGVPSEFKQRCSQNTSERIVKMESAFAEYVREFARGLVKAGQTHKMREMLQEVEKIKGKKHRGN